LARASAALAVALDIGSGTRKSPLPIPTLPASSLWEALPKAQTVDPACAYVIRLPTASDQKSKKGSPPRYCFCFSFAPVRLRPTCVNLVHWLCLSAAIPHSELRIPRLPSTPSLWEVLPKLAFLSQTPIAKQLRRQGMRLLPLKKYEKGSGNQSHGAFSYNAALHSHIMRNIRVATFQFQHAPGDKTANLATIERFVASAAAQKVEIITFPECCISGFWPRALPPPDACIATHKMHKSA
jgi:hypothetical protein